MEAKDYDKRLKEWAESFSRFLNKAIPEKRRVYVITMSRKMPRLLAYLAIRKEDEFTRLTQLLSNTKVEVISEYAIPFAALDFTADDAAIVVDDSVLSGISSSNVMATWMTFTGRMPLFHPLFVSVDAKLTFFEQLLDSEKLALIDDISPYLSETALRITKNSLPADMEHPLLYSDADFNETVSHAEDSLPLHWKRYAVESRFGKEESERVESFSVLLVEEAINSYNNDFSKIRIFETKQGICMEAISPNAVLVDNLIIGEIFVNADYRSLWETVKAAALKSLKIGKPENVSDHTCKSFRNKAVVMTLAMWANYLFSLSAFARNSQMLSQGNGRMGVKPKDLQLLLGKRWAETLSPVIDKVVNEGTSSPSKHLRVALPDKVLPKDMASTYSQLKKSSMSSANSVEDNLNEIFGVSHFSGPLQLILTDGMTKKRNVFGETFESLQSELHPFHPDDSDLEKKTHRWIDSSIDEGSVKPSYRLVRGSDGRIYVRRFFLSGTVR